MTKLDILQVLDVKDSCRFEPRIMQNDKIMTKKITNIFYGIYNMSWNNQVTKSMQENKIVTKKSSGFSMFTQNVTL